MNNVIVKKFDELDIHELYKIMETRVAVFVVEQECPYPEIDGQDEGAMHLFIKDGNSILAYLRILERSDGVVHVGRVLTTKRGGGLGKKVLQAGIETSWNVMNADKIYLEAQVYAKGFYENEGFEVSGEEFLEDGIPHVPMTLERSK